MKPGSSTPAPSKQVVIHFVNAMGGNQWQVPADMSLIGGLMRVIECNKTDLAFSLVTIEIKKGNKSTFL